MPHAKMLQTQFYPALSRAKLRRVTFHTLRHSCASAMIASGAPITEVQHRLGHANPAITLLVYSHFLKHSESDVADRLADELLSSPFATRAQKDIQPVVGSLAS
jgi:integrase